MKKIVAALLLPSALLAACSSNSHKSTTATTAPASGAGSATTAAGGGSKAPVKIALLDFETGAYATPDRHNAIELAIKQINAAGGIDGHMFQYKAYDTGILPQTTVTAVDQAVADQPTAILGLAVSSGVQAAASMLKSSGIPTIQEGQDNTTDLSQLGVTNLFRGQPSVTEQSQAAINYLKSLNPHSVGLFDDSDLNSVQAMKTIRKGLSSAGITNFTYREIAQNASDATEAALAMKGTDVVTSDGFPVQESVFVRALASNGVGVHDLMGNSGLVIAGYGLAPWSAISGDSTYSVCDPQVQSNPEASKYVSAYQAAYPSATVMLSNPGIYDAVWLIAKAIEAQNGDLSHAGIVKGLESLTYSGVCDSYHSDDQHTMAHTMYIVTFGANKGEQSLAAKYDNMASR